MHTNVGIRNTNASVIIAVKPEAQYRPHAATTLVL
jgi:hypothetical protein